MSAIGSFPLEEVEEVKALLPSPFISVVEPDVVDVHFAYSSQRKLRVAIQAPSDYPNSSLFIDLYSRSLSDNFLKKLKDLMKAKVKETIGGKQLLVVVHMVFIMMRDNILVAVSDEVQLIRDILSERDELKTLNKKGIVKLSLCDGKYFLKASAKVPSDYPLNAVDIVFHKHNLPDYLIKLVQDQVVSMKYLLMNGMTLDKILAKEKLLEEKKAKKETKAVDIDDLADMKRDIVFLKKLGDLQKETHVKSLRRMKVRLVKKETVLEQQREEEEEREMYDFSELDTDMNRPTFFPLLQYIIVEFFHKLTHEVCILTNTKVLPDNPADASLSGFERLYCGCWFQRKAIRLRLKEPPFTNVKCPKCKEPLASKHYNVDYFKGQQQRHLLRQRKKQEFDEVSDFLGI
eukprot:TRINITY_DN378_c2_g1_i1.p1 TRINITY_DN378_c2_g1~~TRINITY_DN378_c2_g1_i1.p1  ORF type:complete len:403 (+),score=87.87 TRINITY_DN378_c2_g1_i1:201-1409(+)